MNVTGYTTYKGLIAQQHISAFGIFLDFLTEIKPKRILEIGTGGGGFAIVPVITPFGGFGSYMFLPGTPQTRPVLSAPAQLHANPAASITAETLGNPGSPTR